MSDHYRLCLVYLSEVRSITVPSLYQAVAKIYWIYVDKIKHTTFDGV